MLGNGNDRDGIGATSALGENNGAPFFTICWRTVLRETVQTFSAPYQTALGCRPTPQYPNTGTYSMKRRVLPTRLIH